MNTTQIAQRLRAMHEARMKALTPPGEPQRYSITALDERWADLLIAADALERETAARQQAQIEREEAIAARNRSGIEFGREWRDKLRTTIRRLAEEHPQQPDVAVALGTLADLMGAPL